MGAIAGKGGVRPTGRKRELDVFVCLLYTSDAADE